MGSMRVAAVAILVVAGCGSAEPTLEEALLAPDAAPWSGSVVSVRGPLAGDQNAIAGVDAWRAAGFGYGTSEDAAGLPNCVAPCTGTCIHAGCATWRCAIDVRIDLADPQQVYNRWGVWWPSGLYASGLVVIRDDLAPAELRSAVAKGIGGALGLEPGGDGLMAPRIDETPGPTAEDLAALAAMCD